MTTTIALECACGAVAGEARGVTPFNARRLSCYCDDCQMYAQYLGRAPSLLDARGGTELLYATQARVAIERGPERLRAVRLYPSGMLRVYAGCCRAAVAHVPSPKLAFVGIPHTFVKRGAGAPSLDVVLGARVLHLQARYARAEPPRGAHRGTPLHLALWGLGAAVWDTVRGQARPSAFHSGSGEPRMPVVALSTSERERLRAELPSGGRAASRVAPQGCS